MMKGSNLERFLIILAVVVGFIGFRFVTQAGQGLGVVQNDGYGGTGGAMILASGFVLGLLADRPRNKKK